MIEVENISKIYKKKVEDSTKVGLCKKSKQEFYAVNNVSFKVDDGEILGFVGPNGAGKSTTIKMMTGILTPSMGTIRVNGLVPYKERKRYVKDIGVVFGQRTQLWWDIPLKETYKLLKEVYMIEDYSFNDSIEYLDYVLDLKDIMDSPVRSLSLGQRMKADIAASLIHSPNILFLDEPTIGLDVVAKDKIISAIKDINKNKNVTVILTTHDLSDIEKLCNRIVVIDKGKKIYDDDLVKLKNRYSKNKYLEIRFDDKEEYTRLDYIKEFGVGIKNLKIKENILQITVNSETTDALDVMHFTLSSAKVSDINVKDDDISDIIKQFYVEGILNEKIL